MKTIFLSIFIFLTSFINSQTNWYTNYDSASRVAALENKTLLVVFTGSDWCSLCIKLKQKVFNDEYFNEWSKDFVLVEIDFPKDNKQTKEHINQNRSLQIFWKIQYYPTVLFIEVTDDKKLEHKSIGRLGYISGGAKKWTVCADDIIKNMY
jgi:protein disulfide-isomerase